MKKNIAALVKLSEIQNLKDNWNGYGAEAFTSAHIKIVKNILNKISRTPNGVYPTSFKSIELEFSYKKRYLCFEVFENKTLVFLKVNGINIERSFINDRELSKKINNVVNNFYKLKD